MRLSIAMILLGNQLTIIFQLTKSETTSRNGFRDIYNKFSIQISKGQ